MSGKKVGVKGLYFVEDILDENGRKISRMVFNSMCVPVQEINEYLRYIENSTTNSYNTVKRYSDDICYFYNYLTFAGIKIYNINYVHLSKLLEYLLKLKVRSVSGEEIKKSKYAIENSLINTITFINNKLNKITAIRNTEGLSEISISRIFTIIIRYLEYLERMGKYKFEISICLIISNKIIKGFLRAKGINSSHHQFRTIDWDDILKKFELELIMKNATMPYEKLLYFILNITGIRIGELLGMAITSYGRDNLRESLKGDITFKKGRWCINIKYRSGNEYFRRGKSYSDRSIFLKKSEICEFEILMQRYLNFRIKKCKSKTNKWLFLNSNGNELTQNTAYKQFKRTLERGDLSYRTNITLHNFRHTFITRQLNDGVPIEYVSMLVGHKNIETTRKTYYHVTASELGDIREKYDDYVDKEYELTSLDIVGLRERVKS
ncbi:tyrosine-type recombinase/integrase [Clostridium akagii]|uniref:tyrosine-type recombinase/integrase n=1 Tax=Clostridium akagii TaxID=91623 RepID=UPI00047A0CF9|nr:tyrosine-type recombinase/integrase [Clostridium akagii]